MIVLDYFRELSGGVHDVYGVVLRGFQCGSKRVSWDFMGILVDSDVVLIGFGGGFRSGNMRW